MVTPLRLLVYSIEVWDYEKNDIALKTWQYFMEVKQSFYVCLLMQ